MGAYAVAQYGENYPESIQGIFPFAPVISGELSFEAQERFEPEKLKSWKKTGWFSRTSVSKPGLILTLPWSHMEERLKHNLLKKAPSITFPVLVVVGENDTSCPPEHQHLFLDAIPDTTNKEFHIIKDAPHTFKSCEHLEELRSIFDTWLKKINCGL
jgi:pimeloyl-ACP methyl ester carboxylesterase